MPARLPILVQPRASRNEIVGRQGDALKVRLTAPPVEGAANKALVAFLADALGVRRSEVRVTSGDHARQKVVEFASLTEKDLAERLEAMGFA